MARVLVVIGTRPEAIKLAPVVRQLRASDDLSTTVIALGQHRELLSETLASLDIVPDEICGVMGDRQSLTHVTRRVLDLLPPVLNMVRPEMVVVAGDTNTAMAAALGAFYERIPVAHVEAGLRSGERDAPFPEETNRTVIAQLASLHFAPTEVNRRNLLREGVAPETILVTGNPVIDCLRWALAQPWQPPTGLEWLYDHARPLLLVTAHRRESWGKPMRSIGRALESLASRHPGWHFVCCLHPNPAVRQALLSKSAVTYIDPLPYVDFVRLLERAEMVITDSGGLQEEAPALGVPVLVLRETTERVEAVAAGSAALIGTGTSEIVSEVGRLLEDDQERCRMRRHAYQYGDGFSAQRIVQGLRRFLHGARMAPARTGRAPAWMIGTPSSAADPPLP